MHFSCTSIRRQLFHCTQLPITARLNVLKIPQKGDALGAMKLQGDEFRVVGPAAGVFASSGSTGDGDAAQTGTTILHRFYKKRK